MKYEDIKVNVTLNGSVKIMNSAEIIAQMKTLELAQQHINDEYARIDGERRLNNATAISKFAIEMTALTHGTMGNKITAIKHLRTIMNPDNAYMSLLDAKNLVECLINTYEKIKS